MKHQINCAYYFQTHDEKKERKEGKKKKNSTEGRVYLVVKMKYHTTMNKDEIDI